MDNSWYHKIHKIYKTLKMTHHESPNYANLKVNLKAFNTILKQTIHAAKYMYYESTFSRNKTNIGNTWKTINEIISKSPPKKQFPTFFRDGQKEITEKLQINLTRYLHTLVLINLTTLTILEIKHIKHTLKNQKRYL